MYLPRTLSATLRNASAVFPVVMITGPRQVGKTSLLQACAAAGRNYVSLDDMQQRDLAKRDPALFLQINPPPLIIDEIQYAPELFGAIKLAVDKSRSSGMFWLTGSQKFHLMQGITESLAGRVAIIDMLGFSQAEMAGRAAQVSPFLPTDTWLATATPTAPAASIEPKQAMDIYRAIWRGGYPGVALNPAMPWALFYSSYVQTYLQRDVRDLTRVGDETAFMRFLRAAAARTGQLINFADLARDVDIDQKTAKAWLSILETSGIVYLLQPYHSNLTKRLIKTPKLYFLDTGLCAYLTQWSSPEALEAGAMSGAILETFMLTEILKSYWHNGQTAPFYFYRDKDQKEIDLLIEQDQTLYPVEFKKTASPNISAARHFSSLGLLGLPIGQGAVVCLRETAIPLSREVLAIPAAWL